MVWSFSPVASPEMGEKALRSSVAPGSLRGQWAGEGAPERMVPLGSILRHHRVAPQTWEASVLCLSPPGSHGFPPIALCLCWLVATTLWVHALLKP